MITRIILSLQQNIIISVKTIKSKIIYLFSTDNKSPITLVVEKDKHRNFAWFSVYKYNALDTVKDVSTMYWCRGIVDNTGAAAICKVGFLADTVLYVYYSLTTHNVGAFLFSLTIMTNHVASLRQIRYVKR
jgi:hypothetical protein